MREKTVHIEVLGRKLFGMVHLPEGAGPFPGLILYHGFTGSSIEQHRLFVKIARAAVKTGTVCVRFDFSGAGQSEGCSEDYDFNDWTDDALEIYKFTRGLPEVDADRISAGGFSMGAAVLMYLHSEKKTAFFKHIYMAPAVDLPEIIPGIMENAKDRGDYFDVWGNKISKKAMRAAMETDLFSRAHGPFPESAVYHCADDQSVPAALGKALYEFLGANGSRSILKIYETGGHTFADTEVQDELLEDISRFICGGGK